MRSALLDSEVRHTRFTPREHRFGYRTFMFALDLDELESHALDSPLLRYNNPWGIFTIRSSDYVTEDTGTIRERLERFLSRNGMPERFEQITLITTPRYLGYAFNPVSFYLLERSPVQEFVVVCEVNNTFGEKHLYLLSAANLRNDVYSFPKRFFVSPFFDISGEYTVRVKRLMDEYEIAIALTRGETLAFSASLTGKAAPLTSTTLVRTILRYPLCGRLTMIRIHFQAVILMARRRVDIFQKPAPADSCTIRSRQSIIHNIRLRILDSIRHITHDSSS